MGAELFDKKSVQTESIETNKQRIQFAVSPERFREGLSYAYNQNKSRFNIPGFRKGKAPKQLIEMQYGKEIFYPEAVDYLLDEAFEAVMDETGLDTVGRPEADVESVSAEEGVVFVIEVYTRPKAEVGEYKGLAYDPVDTEATDEEIDARISETRERNSRLISVTDRAAEIDDIVTLDYSGSIDGVLFDGGTAEGHELTLGSNTFIEGFENQLVGAAIDEERDVNVTFPGEYHAPELAGKPAVFRCIIKDIRSKELPELNDDFAQDVSEFDTFAEYRESVAKEISEQKAGSADRDKENQVIEKLIAITTVDIPEVMVEQQIDTYVNDVKSRIENGGMPFNIYLQYTGMTMEQLRDGARDKSVDHVKARLAMEAIVEKEGITVTEEDVTDELGRIAEMYGMPIEAIQKVFKGKELKKLETDLRVNKAVELVLKAAKPN